MSLVRQTGSCVYVLYIEDHEVFKIGFTRNFPRRLKDWRRAIPFEDLRPIALHYLKRASELESALHRRFEGQRVANSEWFRLDDEHLSLIRMSTRRLCAELMVEFDRDDIAEQPEEQEEDRDPVEIILDECRTVIEEVQARYAKEMSWRAVADHYGVSKGIVWRVANEYYQPRDTETRIKLGLPVFTKAAVAQVCEYGFKKLVMEQDSV